MLWRQALDKLEIPFVVRVGVIEKITLTTPAYSSLLRMTGEPVVIAISGVYLLVDKSIQTPEEIARARDNVRRSELNLAALWRSRQIAEAKGADATGKQPGWMDKLASHVLNNLKVGVLAWVGDGVVSIKGRGGCGPPWNRGKGRGTDRHLSRRRDSTCHWARCRLPPPITGRNRQRSHPLRGLNVPARRELRGRCDVSTVFAAVWHTRDRLVRVRLRHRWRPRAHRPQRTDGGREHILGSGG